MMLFQGLLPQMELLKKMFPTILDMKNAKKVQKKKKNPSSTKDRMVYFSISVTVKHQRHNKNLKK